MSDERLPARADIPNPAEVGLLDLSGDGSGRYGWRIVSDCGVVKVYSTRDGCMTALNPVSARRVAEEFASMMARAADLTEIRSYGKPSP